MPLCNVCSRVWIIMSYPNKRSLYILYLDSIKYLRPEIMISAKESLHSLVYHEILVCVFKIFVSDYLFCIS